MLTLHKLSEALQSIQAHPQVLKGVKSLGSYSFTTIKYLFALIAVTPHLVYSLVYQAKPRLMVKKALEVVLKDIAPALFIKRGCDLFGPDIEAYLAGLHEDGTSKALGLYYLCYVMNQILQFMVFRFLMQKNIEQFVYNNVSKLVVADTFHEANNEPAMVMCQDEKCSNLRFLQGSIRDLVAFYATEKALVALSHLLYLGEPLAFALSIVHQGRYILTLVLPDLCNRHQMHYMNEYSELALALGLMHALLSSYLVKGIENNTAAPASYYQDEMKHFVFLVMVGVAAHLKLPAPVAKSSRQVFDPLAIYQSIIGGLFDAMATGLKIKLPLILKKTPDTGLKLKNCMDFLIRVVNFTGLKALFFWMLPPILQSRKAFVEDKIIQPYWEDLRLKAVGALVNIEDIHRYPAVKIVMRLNKKIVVNSVQLIFGMPTSLTKLALRLLANDEFMQWLILARRELESLSVTAPSSRPQEAPTQEAGLVNHQLSEVREPSFGTISLGLQAVKGIVMIPISPIGSRGIQEKIPAPFRRLTPLSPRRQLTGSSPAAFFSMTQTHKRSDVTEKKLSPAQIILGAL